ncbi:MAG: glutathione S-transferase [Rhodocyclaceae bacterium]|nr:glutathione S-transferase [Rhodocyclaceae bacterium]
MKLIGSHTSPFVRKVRIVLAEKKIDCEFVVDNPWTDDSRVTPHNPLARIPVLLLDDESSLFDSRVIVEYLDSVTPNNKLLPAAGRERIAVKRWEALADGICDAAASAVMERKRPAGEQSPSWITRQLRVIDLGLKEMAKELGDAPWCQGNSPCLADIAVGTALGYLDFRFSELEWRGAHPNLARLAEKLAQRPSFADTLPHD